MATTGQKWGYGLPDQAQTQPLQPAEPEPAAPPRFKHLRGNLTGGFSAAVLTIPVSMGYGMLALAPLGDYVAQCVLADWCRVVLRCFTRFSCANTTML